MPETIEATYRIVTPMFIGGADQSPSDGIRPPSVKGALRFWWRALNWSRVRGQADNEEKALKLLHQEEANLFGQAATDDKKDGGNGQSLFLLRVFSEHKDGTSAASEGNKYMLGQGLINARGEYQRSSILDGSFNVKLLFRPGADQDKQYQIAIALFAWGLLGGLGSRSRRGIGSVAIERFEGANAAPEVPQNIEQFKNAVKTLRLPVDCDLPPFTAFSTFTRMDCSVSSPKDNAWDILNDVGLEMMRYRGWGFQRHPADVHRVAGIEAEQNFPDDHHNILKAVQGCDPGALPDRAVFGLPHNYFFKSEFDSLKNKKEGELIKSNPGLKAAEAQKRAKGWAGNHAKAEIAPATEGSTRRASPLLIHAHRFPDGKAAIIQTLLPAVFLPSDTTVAIKALRLSEGRVEVPIHERYSFIHTYLDRFEERIPILSGRPTP